MGDDKGLGIMFAIGLAVGALASGLMFYKVGVTTTKEKLVEAGLVEWVVDSQTGLTSLGPTTSNTAIE